MDKEETESTSLSSPEVFSVTTSKSGGNWARTASYSQIHSEHETSLLEHDETKKKCCMFNSFQVPLTITCLVLIIVGVMNIARYQVHFENTINPDDDKPLIIAVTPTYKRITRMADMLRCAQSLMFVQNIFWVVVEDGLRLSTQVEALLNRSSIPYKYMAASTAPGWPKKGWWQRNQALNWIMDEFSTYNKHAVVYFMDDDNAYDHRLFNEYVRNVQNLGVWAVGLVGDSLVEAPHVEDGVVTKWNAYYFPTREYAVDMAGFGIGLHMFYKTGARIEKTCTAKVPEICLLRQLGIPKEQAEVFGWRAGEKEVLVWHVKTVERVPRGINSWGYDVETLNARELSEHRNYSRRRSPTTKIGSKQTKPMVKPTFSTSKLRVVPKQKPLNASQSTPSANDL